MPLQVDFIRDVAARCVSVTWPNLTATYTLNGVLGLVHNYTDDEVKKLRAAGINVLQQRPDGKVQFGMGGGIASDGSSMAVRRETDRFVEHIDLSPFTPPIRG